MLDSHSIEALTKRLFAALPSSMQQAEKNIQRQFKDILQAAFAHMDLVTREEFDVQTKVLLRTREKVEALQSQLNELTKNSK